MLNVRYIFDPGICRHSANGAFRKWHHGEKEKTVIAAIRRFDNSRALPRRACGSTRVSL